MKRIITLSFICFCIKTSFAQYWEAGVTSGATTYIGDLQPKSPETGSYGFTYGALARLHYSPKLSFKATAIAGGFYATDRYDVGTRRYRNLEVETSLYELAATAEWNIAQYNILDGKTTSPYLFAGIGGLYFNPRARTPLGETSTWVNLRPLGTEGQTLDGGKKYSPIQVVIPFGVGLKIAAGRKLNIGLELGFRQTFTDYLDDVGGNYPDLVALAAKDPLAASMSFRTREVTGTDLELPSGLKRGDNYKFDMYVYFGVTATYNLANNQKMEFNSAYRSFWGENK